MPTATPTKKKRRYILQTAYLAKRCRPDLDKRIKEALLGLRPIALFAPYVLEDRRWLVFDFEGDLVAAKETLKVLKEDLPFVARAEIMESFDDGTYAMKDKWAWERESDLAQDPG